MTTAFSNFLPVVTVHDDGSIETDWDSSFEATYAANDALDIIEEVTVHADLLDDRLKAIRRALDRGVPYRELADLVRPFFERVGGV